MGNRAWASCGDTVYSDYDLRNPHRIHDLFSRYSFGDKHVGKLPDNLGALSQVLFLDCIMKLPQQLSPGTYKFCAR